MNTPSAAVAAYRALHQTGCFVLPNPWDAGGAIYLEHAGFRALATTSAGMAFARGLPDDPRAVPVEAMLAHVAEMVRATSLPVNADFQSGYGEDPEGVAKNVRACVATGVAGLSIEDATGEKDKPLYDRDVAIARFRAARAAVDAGGGGAVLTARCEAFLVGVADPERVVLDRLVAFADAGADCLYAPMVRDEKTIAAIVRAVAPKPVNVLAWSGGPSVARLAELGVRRISVGSGLARVAWGAFQRAARNILDHGTFDFSGGASFDELNALFGGK